MGAVGGPATMAGGTLTPQGKTGIEELEMWARSRYRLGTAMDAEDFETDVLSLLKLDARTLGRLKSRESTRLEYKQTFNWGAKAEYAKSMIAFANHRGGYIVFGVKNQPHDLVGLNVKAFDRLDDHEVSSYLGDVIAPEIEWSRFTIELGGKQLGVIAVAPCTRGPVICARNDGSDLQDGAIYYRYRAQSTRIGYTELARIIDDRLKRERQDLHRLFSRMATVGPAESAVLDFRNGELAGRAGSLVIDESTLRKVRFVREGHFKERDGDPTLMLVGEVLAVPDRAIATAVRVEKPVAVGEREILTAFLRRDARGHPDVYLQQICREQSAYLPVFFFARQAGMDNAQLREYVESTCTRKQTREQLLARCAGKTVVPVGSTETESLAAEELNHVLAAIEDGDDETLRNAPRTRLFQAVTHLTSEPESPALIDVLSEIVEEEFPELDSNERSLSRKAVARLDELTAAVTVTP